MEIQRYIKMKKEHESDQENRLNYRNVFYKGKNPWELKRVFNGPWGMKDIRFIQLKDGKIAFFSRPQGGNAGRGKVGFFTINSFEELTHKLLGSNQHSKSGTIKKPITDLTIIVRSISDCIIYILKKLRSSLFISI